MESRAGGTVKSQILQYNIRAKNGTWNVFQLILKGKDLVCAWFVCHSEVDPEVEIDKILRVSGSPYEYDSGSHFNNEKTAAEGVLVLNRYDWGYYNDLGKQELGIDDDADMENFSTYVFGEGAGLVDLESAKTEVQRWQEKKLHEIDTQPHGIWMFIPAGEYMFGRFGLDEARTAARSFLFFTTHTYFTHTTFAGLDHTLRQEETHEERFHRYLREGRDFERLHTLEGLLTGKWHSSTEMPTESEYLGPYDSHEYLLDNAIIDAIRSRGTSRVGHFANQWKEACYTFLNELIMTFLEHYIPPASSHGTVDSAATFLFPGRSEPMSISTRLHRLIAEPDSDPISNFDTSHLRLKIRSFLSLRCEGNSLIRDDNFISGICACVMYLLMELLEQVTITSLDSYHSQLVPVDIRLSVRNNDELLNLFKYSKVFWRGTGQAVQVPGFVQSAEATDD